MGATLWTDPDFQEYASIWQPGQAVTTPYVEPWYLGNATNYATGVIPADSTLKPYNANLGATLPTNAIFTSSNPRLYFQTWLVERAAPPTDYTILSQALYAGALQPLSTSWVPGPGVNNWAPTVVSMDASGTPTANTGRFYIAASGSLTSWSGGVLTIAGQYLDLVITFGAGTSSSSGPCGPVTGAYSTCAWEYSSRY